MARAKQSLCDNGALSYLNCTSADLRGDSVISS